MEGAEMSAIVAITLYAIGAAWVYLLNRELAFSPRLEAIGYAMIWPALALWGIYGSVVRAIKGEEL